MPRRQSYKPPPLVQFAWKAYARSARESARAQRRMEEEAVKEANREAREQKRTEKEEFAAYQQRLRESADLANTRLEERVENLKHLHLPFIEQTGPDLNAMIRRLEPAVFEPPIEPSTEPVPPVEVYLQAVRPASFFERLLKSTRYDEELAAARQQHQADVAQRQNRLQRHADNLEKARRQHSEQESQKEEARDHLTKMRRGVLERQPDSIAQYCELCLDAVELPDEIQVEFGCEYETGVLQLNVIVPDRAVVPEIASVRYVIKRDETETIARKETAIKAIYQAAIAGLLVGAIRRVFDSDPLNIRSIDAKAVIPGHDRRTGQRGMEELISLSVSQSQWRTIDVAHIEPLPCLRSLSAQVGERWKTL